MRYSARLRLKPCQAFSAVGRIFLGVPVDIRRTYIRAGTGVGPERSQEPLASSSALASASSAASKPSRSAADRCAAESVAWASAGCVAAWICCRARIATCV